METKYYNTPFELKTVSDAGAFEGYGAVFNNIDDGGDIIQQGAFTKSLAEWKGKKALPPVLWYHNPAEPIGAFDKLNEDQKGLHVSGQLWIDSPATDAAVKAYRGLKAGNVTGLSIGFKTSAADYNQDGNRLLKEVDLFEVSIIPFPMNDSARVLTVKAAYERGEVPQIKLLETALRDAGLSRKEAKSVLASGYKTMSSVRDASDDCEGLKTLLHTIRGINNEQRNTRNDHRVKLGVQ